VHGLINITFNTPTVRSIPVERSKPEIDSLFGQTRRSLKRYGHRTKKSLGQHFLVDEGIVRHIIDAARLDPGDVILEVGPGLGVLTEELAMKACFLIAVELDNKLAAILRNRLAPAGNVAVINSDILDIEPAVLLGELKREFPEVSDTPFSYKVVANLPYYITSVFLRKFLETKVKPEMMVVMVQKEVAEAITARPGDMSVLSVSVQFYGEPMIVSYVPASCFYPVPEVDSAILRIDLHRSPVVAVTDEKSFFKVVRAGFSASRKQIANSLARGLAISKEDAISLLEAAGITPQRRAETLSLDEWAELWRVVNR